MMNSCRTCHAARGMQCRRGGESGGFCATRVLQAQKNREAKLLGSDINLTPGEKALIVYYAFIILCDSVSTKSKEVLGVEHSSLNIQGFFIKQAIEEAKKDGLIS